MKNILYWIMIVCFVFGASGCAMTVSNIRKYELPTDYKGEVEDILNHFKNKFSLRYRYSIEILSEKEMNEAVKSGSPHIRQVSPAGLSTIYIDDLFIKYLYKEPNIYVYRKLYLVCIVAHEICHREYDLPDNPINTHLQVDYKAIDMVKEFGIEWFEYTWALASAENYMGIRRTGGEWQNLFGVLLNSGIALSTGVFYQENDLFDRAIMINDNLGRTDRGWSGRRGRRWRNFIDNKEIWDFPDKHKVGFNQD